MECSMVKRLFHLETKNGRGHYQVLGTNNKSNRLSLKPIVPLRPKRGIIKVDAGRQGAIFLATFNRNGSRQFIIKVCPYDKKLAGKMQVSVLEYNIIKTLYKVVPRRVPKPMGFFKCTNFAPNVTWTNKSTTYDYSKQTIACMEYIENGTFGNYLDRMATSSRRRLNDTAMKSFIRQVLQTLIKIQHKYPSFRHGDLHLDNLLVRPTKSIPELVLTDFGWSKMARIGSNPAVNSGRYKNTYGIGANMSPMYDAHLFLMQLRNWVLKHSSSSKDGFPRTKAFLNKYVPVGYREENDRFTRNFRLKYGIKYPYTLAGVARGAFPLRKIRGGKPTSNARSLRLTPEKSLLIAYGAGPSPNMRASLSIRRAHPNKPSMNVTPR